MRIILKPVLYSVFIAVIGLLSSSLGRAGQLGIGAQREPSITVDKNNNLYLAVATATLPSTAHTPGSQIFFVMSTDGGLTWDNQPVTRNLSNSRITGIGALNPTIVTSRSGKTRAYVGYDDDTAGPRQVYFIRSKKLVNFKGPVRLADGGGFNPRLAADSLGGISVVWGNSPIGPRQVAFVRSVDFGVTFGSLVTISNSSGEGFAPSIAIDSQNTIYVVWQDTGGGGNAVMFSRSTDLGATFATPSQLSASTAIAGQPQVTIDSAGGVTVAWVETLPNAAKIMISRSTDSGQTFSTPAVVTSRTGADFEGLVMAPSAPATYLAYSNDTAKQVYLVRGARDASNFSSPVQVSTADTSKGRAHSPSIAADGTGRLHMAWIDSSILGSDEGLLIYSNTTDGHTLSGTMIIFSIVQPAG